MNKTRMGKRAASLLLSLVMMLSLLPTAAYAAMGYADDTQGAIVSENGTDVSDDSNSSGGTGDLQVGDSKDSGDTGDQQVGGSSVSGTAGDTTGAEGGADPIDSVNGNDSADPQDDGDAVLPVASSVVSTSEELVAAIAAASDGDTITLGAGEFTTVGNTSPEKSLTFVGAGTGTVWTIGDLDKDVGGEGNGDYSFEGCDTITFKNMTLKVDNKNYRGFIRINHTVVENCTLEGRTAYWGYETAKFVGSTFTAPEGDYALRDYSTKDMSFDGCKFNISGKGVHVYVEAANADKDVTRTVAVNNCTVNSTKENKAFLNIKNSTQSYDVTLSGTNTVNGLAADGTTGSALYQVETTEVTETTGKPVAVKAKADDGTVTTLYEVKETVEASVAEVNGAKYKSLQAAVDAAKSGATVTLLADTRENVTVSKNAIVLDLNGHTLNGGTENAKPALTVDNKKVTLKDSSEAQTGTIKREDTADTKTSHYVIDIQGKNGFMIVESGKVENNSGIPGVKGSSLIRLGNDSVSGWPTLTIKGGTFTQDNFIAIKVDRGTLHLLGGTVNSANSFAIENWNNAYIKGGTVNGTVSTWVYSTGAAFSKLEISGGTVNGNVASVNYDNAADKQARVYVTGGTVTGTLGTYTYNNGLVAMDETAKATIEVTGGTFSKDPTQYVVEDSAISKNDDGTYGVAKTYLAKIGDTEYYTMDEAFHAVKAGETIVMLRDYTTNKVQNSGDESFTIDLGGHTWTANIVDTASAAFEINYSDVTLTVKNGKVVSSQLAGLIPSAMSGTITYNNSELVFDGVEMTANGHSGIETNGSNTNDTVTLKNSTLNVPNGYGIYFPSSGTLTIDNSVINAKTMGVQVCSGSLNISGAGTAITVTGDGIAKTENDGAIEDGAAISIVERTGYKGLIAIKVESGTFTAKAGNDAVKAYKWDNTNKTESAFDNSKNVVAVSGGTFSSEVDKSLCAKGYIPTKNADGTYSVKEGQYVAEVNGAKYATLAEAINAATNDQTVRLLADATEDVVISKSITLDLGGKTLTNTNGGKATISVTGGTVTVQNGSVIGGTSYYNIEVTKNSNANLTLTDVTATAGNTGSSMIDNYGTLTITSGTYTGGLNVVKSEEDSVLNISGGTFTLNYATNGYTGVIFAYGDTTISGGEFIQNLTTTGKWDHPQVIATGVVEGHTAITRVTGGSFTNKKSGEYIFRGVGKATSDNFEVSGGTFNKSIPDGYCADGFIPTKNTDGTYGVKEGQYVAKVGSTKYETLADAIRLAAKGQTVKLLADVADCGSLTISKNITLDGGGHTISGNSSISVNMPGNAAADVTIKNVNFKDIANGNKLSAFYFSQVKGKLTITGCTFDSIEYEAIQVTPMEGAEVNVSSNVFKAKADGTQVRHIHIEMAYGSGFDCEGQNIKLTVTDNQLHGTVSGDASMGIWWVGTDSTLKVDGNYMEHPETVSITLSNGGVHYNRGDLIYPARSQADADVDDLMPAVIVADKASGESKIKAYSTLADAINAAQDGQTVRLLADVEQNTQLAIDKSITLDLNGKTIKNTADIWGDNANAILSITNGAKVTITGNGTIDAKENDCYTINVVKGDLTIENGTFYGNVSVVQVEEGTLSVKGGTFDLHQKWEGSNKYLFNCIDSEFTSGNAKVAISGGTFVGFDPNVSPEQKVDGKAPSFAAPGTGITRNADGSFTAVDGMTAQILDKDGNSVKAYRTLAEAVAAAEDGQTVRLLADVEQNTQLIINKSITLDLNGKTIKISGYTAEKAQVSVKGNLTIQDSSEAQTGKICSDYTGTAGRVVSVENGGKLTIAGGTITTEGMSGLSGSAVYIASGAEVNMTGGTVKVDAKRGNVAMNVKGSTGVFIMSGGSVIAEAGDGTETYITAISGSPRSTIQISAGTVSGPQAVFAGSSATTITGGNFTGSITVKNGSISGGTFDRALDKKACAAGYVPTQNGDGTYGVEIGKFTVMVTSRTTGSDSPVANVAGGGSDITYAQGTTVTASAISGYKFVGWFVNEYTGTPYSTDLSCEVKPTADCTMIAVYEPISGGKFWLTVTASEFTVNGGAVQDSYLYEQFAVGASVTVNFTGSENFLYWVNASNKVVSTEKSYTFIMGSETTLKAVYGKTRQNQATVVFISHSDQIISSKAYTTSDTIQFPVPPIKMGCTFTGWSMTEAEIRAAMANNSGIIQVRALYTEPSIACKVTVVYPEGTDNQVVNAVVGKAIDVTAKDIEGKTFSYWTDDKGTVLGYTKTLKLAPSGDMTVKAVYGENAEVKPVISMTAIDASAGNGYWVVSFTATRAVPAGYEMVKQGILYSLDSRCAGEAGKDYLKLTADGTVPEGVYEYSGTDQALNGVTRFNGKVGTADTTLYGRGYMILKNSAGEVLYVYADTILSGSYNSLKK